MLKSTHLGRQYIRRSRGSFGAGRRPSQKKNTVLAQESKRALQNLVKQIDDHSTKNTYFLKTIIFIQHDCGYSHNQIAEVFFRVLSSDWSVDNQQCYNSGDYWSHTPTQLLIKLVHIIETRPSTCMLLESTKLLFLVISIRLC